jgi:hypothetical protein
VPEDAAERRTPMEPITTPQPTLVVGQGTQCAACGTPLAGDQRYCLDCGEPNGEPRLVFADNRGAPAPAPTPPPPRRPASRAPAGATVIAGIATLLIALGVGVEIGRSSNDNKTVASAPPVRFVTVPGAAAPTASTTPAPGASATATATPAARGAKGAKSKSAATPKPAATATATPPPTVKVGSTCKSGTAGCSKGKFTGDFFGGG